MTPLWLSVIAGSLAALLVLGISGTAPPASASVVYLQAPTATPAPTPAPNSPEFFFNRGEQHRSQREWDAANADSTEAIRLKPDYAAAYYYRGLVYSIGEDFDHAISDSSQAITRRPGHAEAYYVRGYAHKEKGDPDGAIADLTTAIDLHKSELMLENALLRQQLITLRVQRQVKRPYFTRRDRLSPLLLASHLPNWKQVLLILKPDTLLRWHCQGFALFWRFRTRTRRGRSPLAPHLRALIQRIAAENPTWGAKRLRGELLKLGLPVAKAILPTHFRRFRPPRSSSLDWNTLLKSHVKDVGLRLSPGGRSVLSDCLRILHDRVELPPGGAL